MENTLENVDGQELTRYHWMLISVTTMASITVWVDNTAVAIILPKIMSGFGLNVTKGSWVVNSTFLAVAVMIPASGWLGNTFGRNNVYKWSLGLFMVSIILCGLAWSSGALIFFRVMVGIASGAIMPTSHAIIFENFPENKRGIAIGIYSFCSSAGIAFATVFLGKFAEEFAWRAFFYFNAPLAMFSFLSALLMLRKQKRQPVVQLDLLGSSLMVAFLLSLLLALTQGRRYGWHSDYILILFLVFAVSFVLFIVTELNRKSPFVELRLYKSYVYVLASIIAGAYGVILIGTSFLVPLFAQTVLGYDVFKTSLITLPSMLVGAVALLIAGWMADRFPARIPITMGLLFYILSMYSMSRLNYQSSFQMVMALVVLREVGGGLLFAPLIRASLSALPLSQVGMGSGLLNMNRQIGGMVGIAFFGTFLEGREVFYRQVLGESQAASPYAANYFLSSVKSLFVHQGSTEALASAKALTVLNKVVGLQAMVNSFNDIFLLVAIMVAIVIIPALLIK
jgi:DHA2 family multidrug resistance protein